MSGSPFAVRTVLLAACVSFTACNHATAPPKVRVALVADAGGFADRSFNEAASNGLAECATATGVEVTTAAPASAADYETQLTLLATQDFDAVIAVGDGMAVDLTKVARRFEGTHFAILGSVVNAPNVESITFREQDGSFLAGALAALVTRTKSVAFLGGVDGPRLAAAESGFTAGARQIDPSVRVVRAFVGSYDDAERARAASRALYAGGADVVYVVAGAAGSGAIAAAKESRAGYAIGVDNDQDALAPGKVLTSVVKRVDRAAARVCLEAMSQKPTSGHVELGLAEGGVGLTPFKYTRALIGAKNIARLARLENAIVAGAITPPATPAELANFRPVQLSALPVRVHEPR